MDISRMSVSIDAAAIVQQMVPELTRLVAHVLEAELAKKKPSAPARPKPRREADMLEELKIASDRLRQSMRDRSR